MADRPLSPHLFDGMRIHYRWGPHMLVSIVHRVTGQGLSFVGIPVLLWWLGALVAGPEAYGKFVDIADSPIGYIVLIGLSWAFFTHLCSGLRHFVLDVGAGYELDTNTMWSWIVPAIGIVLTVLFWAAIYLR